VRRLDSILLSQRNTGSNACGVSGVRLIIAWFTTASLRTSSPRRFANPRTVDCFLRIARTCICCTNFSFFLSVSTCFCRVSG